MAHTARGTERFDEAYVNAVYVHEVLPRLERYAKYRLFWFRHGDQREERTQLARIAAWRRCVNLARNGQDPAQWSSLIARYAVASAAARHAIPGQSPPKPVGPAIDALDSDQTVRFGSIADDSKPDPTVLDAVTDDGRGDPARIVPPRLDYRQWVALQPSPVRGFLRALMRGHGLTHAAAIVGRSRTWANSTRKAARASWAAFQGE